MPEERGARAWLAAALALAVSSAGAAADLPPHPRLLTTGAGLAAIAPRAAADPLLASLRDATLAAAEAMHVRRTCEYRIPDGRRLLGESRQALDTILHTAMAWRLTGDRRHLDRCVRELDAACGLADWHPPHFLDTAEMATAVAIGLDWLHDDLTADQRARYREAILAKAITPARGEFTAETSWTRVNNNWAQVCGTGIALACLAVAKDEEHLGRTPWHECLRTVVAAARFYEPDGCYPEGPGYWSYGTSYHVAALATLESLGRPEPVPAALLRSAAFMAHARGPTGTLVNFADCDPMQDKVVAARSWLATRAADPAVVADLRDRLRKIVGRLAAGTTNDRFFPLHLLWLPPQPPDAAEPLPRAAVFHGEQPFAAFRTSWTDPDAVFVAVKGGTPQGSHAHMDVGGFVVEADGRRWLHDLGGDSYNLPGYFRDQRWTYFRLNSRSHNVISIAGGLQNPKCPSCGIEAVTDRPPYSARLDLGPAYAAGDQRLAGGVIREVTLDPDDRVVRIRDVISDPVGAVRWQVLVDVEPAIDGASATLADGSRGLRLTANVTPAGSGAAAGWRAEPAHPATPQEKPNEGFWLLSYTVEACPRVTVDVELRPLAAAPATGD